jgi:hypothetical protein
VVTLAPSQTGDKPQLNLPSAQKGPVELRPFIESFIAVGGSQSRGLAELQFYADEVDYFDHGWVNRGFIAQDIQKYTSRWPRRRYRIDGEIQIYIADQQRGVIGATFRLNFAVQNSKRQSLASVAMLYS